MAPARPLDVRRSEAGALQDLSHDVTEPAAKTLERVHPDLAARLWRAQGMRIVDAKKSKYYDAALSNFEHAMRCFERAGLTVEWTAIANDVRAWHHRKSGFLSGFEKLVAGSGPSDEPSFLERAKTRLASDRCRDPEGSWYGEHRRSVLVPARSRCGDRVWGARVSSSARRSWPGVPTELDANSTHQHGNGGRWRNRWTKKMGAVSQKA